MTGAPASAEREPVPAATNCDIGAMDLDGGRLHLIHSCLADRDLASLAQSVVHGRNGRPSETEDKQFATLRTILDVPQGVLEQLLSVVARQEIAAEDIAEQLVQKAEAHHILIDARLAALSPAEPALKVLTESSREAAKSGRYDEASNLLTKFGIAAETQAQTDPATLTESLAAAADARAALGQIAFIRSEYREASLYLEAALRLVAGSDETRRLQYLEALADSHYLQGRDRNDAAALGNAAGLYRELADETPREKSPAKWGVLQCKLGNALLRLGVRSGDVEPLREAVTAFRDGLSELPPARHSREWARAQLDLGAVLLRVGLAENSTARLEEAVAAFRESLKESTRERAPYDWAAAQSSLGTALWSLGARETGTDHYEEAVAAFREGLEETSRNHTPLSWAARQNNLGAALMALSERNNSSAVLRQAVAAFKLALETYMDESATYYIGGVKDNLARAEQLLKQPKPRGRAPARD